jgi:hypothetical protein
MSFAAEGGHRGCFVPTELNRREISDRELVGLHCYSSSDPKVAETICDALQSRASLLDFLSRYRAG